MQDIRDRQYAAWREYRRNGFQWLVSDFVTAGSPLTSARLLLNLDKRNSFKDLVLDRSFPTCPPQTEEQDAPKPGKKRKRFTYTHAYPDPTDGPKTRSRSVQVPHHAAMFALTRWTNLYFPLQGIMRGDFVGGPLREPFGCWINDVSLGHPGGGFMGFAHSLYWRPRGGDIHLQRLREALACEYRPTLEDLSPAPVGYRKAPMSVRQ
jgi:hypothetical protein